MVSVFHLRLLKLTDLYVPVQIDSHKPNGLANSYVSKAIKQKQKAGNTYKAAKSLSDLQTTVYVYIERKTLLLML